MGRSEGVAVEEGGNVNLHVIADAFDHLIVEPNRRSNLLSVGEGDIESVVG